MNGKPVTAGTVKGAPAWESRTGTRLVSPASGCEKKDLSVTRLQNAEQGGTKKFFFDLGSGFF